MPRREGAGCRYVSRASPSARSARRGTDVVVAGSKAGERGRFSSLILPPWARKTPKITEVLPLLFLHGLSSGDFVPALGQFLGSAKGLSGATVTRLTETWKTEAPRVR